MSGDDIKLSIIIVSYNCRQYLLDCLRSIDETRLPFPHEVIVVDNASSDGGIEEAEREFPATIVIRNRENTGFSQANNQGIRLARGELALLLNNDTRVRAGTIEAMVRHLDDDPTLGAAGCALEEADGRLQVSYGNMIGFGNEFYQKYFSRLAMVLRQRTVGLKVMYPHWVSGAFLLSRRALLLEVGLLDEAFFMYTEEVDLCERIRGKGLRIIYDPSWRIMHFGGKSTEKNRAKAGLEYRRSQLYFYSKHHGRLSSRLLKAYLLIRTGLDLTFARIRSDRDLVELRRRIYHAVKDYEIGG